MKYVMMQSAEQGMVSSDESAWPPADTPLGQAVRAFARSMEAARSGVAADSIGVQPLSVPAAGRTLPDARVLHLVPNLPWLAERERATERACAALVPLPVPLQIGHGLQAATLAALFDAEFRVGDYPADLLAFSVAVLRLVQAEIEHRRGAGDSAEYARLDAEVRRLYPSALHAAQRRFQVGPPGPPVDVVAYVAEAAANDTARPALDLPAGGVASVAVSSVFVQPERRERADVAHVTELAESIAAIGLNQPIVITPSGELVAGVHRLLAHVQLGRETILAYVRDLAGQNKRLAEIDENLVRRELPALEHAELLLERKEIYEALHPETRQYRRGGHAKAAKKKGAAASAFSALAQSFAGDTAKKTGLDKRRVQELTQIGRISAAAKDVLRGTALGSQKAELIKLSRLPPAEQHAVAVAMTTGEVKSVAAARAGLRATALGVLPYAVTQAPVIHRHLATAARLQKDMQSLVQDWAAHDAGGMKSFIDYFDAVSDTLRQVLDVAPSERPTPCACRGNENCTVCGGRGWILART